MNCPKCAKAMAMQEVDGVIIDRCHVCGGAWLDKGEMERLVKRGVAHISLEALSGCARKK